MQEEGMMYTVAQVAEMRKVSVRAIQKQLKSHEKELEGHVEMRNRKLWMDEYAVEILREAALNTTPVFVAEANEAELEELKKELERLKAEREEDQRVLRNTTEIMAELFKQHNENANLIAESKLYLEQRDKLEKQLEQVQKARILVQCDADRFREENEYLKEQIEKLKNRSFLERVLKKYE